MRKIITALIAVAIIAGGALSYAAVEDIPWRRWEQEITTQLNRAATALGISGTHPYLLVREIADAVENGGSGLPVLEIEDVTITPGTGDFSATIELSVEDGLVLIFFDDDVDGIASDEDYSMVATTGNVRASFSDAVWIIQADEGVVRLDVTELDGELPGELYVIPFVLHGAEPTYSGGQVYAKKVHEAGPGEGSGG